MSKRRVQFADGTVMKADDAEIRRQQQQFGRGGYRELDNPSDTTVAEAHTQAKRAERGLFANIFGR
jgi:hypothetical protein